MTAVACAKTLHVYGSDGLTQSGLFIVSWVEILQHKGKSPGTSTQRILVCEIELEEMALGATPFWSARPPRA